MILNSKLNNEVKIILRKKFSSLQQSWLISLENNNEINYENNMNNYLISSYEDINQEIINENEINEDNEIQDENDLKNCKKSDKIVKITKKISKNVTKVSPRGKIISSPKIQNREMLSYGNALRICNEISALTIGKQIKFLKTYICALNDFSD